jgi:hypothetical protein
MNDDFHIIDMKYNYIKFCPLCKNEVNFIQTGQKLPQNILDYVLKISHIENHFENYLEYKYIDKNCYKIDVEIIHEKCKNID